VPAKLTLYPSEGVSRHFLLREARSIGRDPECDILLEDPRVSTRHALLRPTGPTWVLQDLQSKNGTFVNAIRITEGLLADEDWVSFGGMLARFEVISEAQVEALKSERSRRLQTFSEARRILDENLEPRALLKTLMGSVLDLTGAERGYLLLFAPEGEVRAEIVAGYGTPASPVERFEGSFGAIERVLRSALSVVTSNAKADAYLGKRPSVVEMGIESLACVPMRSEGQTVGLIYVDGRKRGGPFTDLDVEILEALADHATLVVGSLRLDLQIRELIGAPPAEANGSSPAFLEELERRVGELARASAVAPRPSSP